MQLYLKVILLLGAEVLKMKNVIRQLKYPDGESCSVPLVVRGGYVEHSDEGSTGANRR